MKQYSSYLPLRIFQTIWYGDRAEFARLTKIYYDELKKDSL